MSDKKPLNLSIHQRILELADEIMKARSYTSLSVLVEDLIREKHDLLNGRIVIHAPLNSTDPVPSFVQKLLGDAQEDALAARSESDQSTFEASVKDTKAATGKKRKGLAGKPGQGKVP